jgi:hypothetical protein
MSEVADKDCDALCNAARDISRHIAGMAEELVVLRHARQPGGEPSHKLIEKQINRMRDQVALLGTVMNDIERLECGPHARSA